MAVICRESNFMFLCVPHTGSTSISQHLREHYGGQELVTEHLRNETGKIVCDWKHGSVSQYVQHGAITQSEIDTMTVAATVRNPYDWVVSEYLFFQRCYANITSKDANPKGIEKIECAATKPFTEFVAAYYFKPEKQSMPDRFLAGAPNAHVIKYETLAESFNDLARNYIDAPQGNGVELPHLNPSSNRGHYRDYYDEASRNHIATAFALTIEQCGYEF